MSLLGCSLSHKKTFQTADGGDAIYCDMVMSHHTAEQYVTTPSHFKEGSAAQKMLISATVGGNDCPHVQTTVLNGRDTEQKQGMKLWAELLP